MDSVNRPTNIFMSMPDIMKKAFSLRDTGLEVMTTEHDDIGIEL